MHESAYELTLKNELKFKNSNHTQNGKNGLVLKQCMNIMGINDSSIDIYVIYCV